MKLINEKMANQKFATHWGAMQVDASGVIELADKEAVAFFQDTLKFAPMEAEKSAPAKKAAAPVAAPVVEEKEAEEKEEAAPKKSAPSAKESRFKRGDA